MQHFHPLLRAHAWCGSKTCACVVALQPYDYASTAVARTWALHTAMRACGVCVCAAPWRTIWLGLGESGTHCARATPAMPLLTRVCWTDACSVRACRQALCAPHPLRRVGGVSSTGGFGRAPHRGATHCLVRMGGEVLQQAVKQAHKRRRAQHAPVGSPLTHTGPGMRR